MIRQAQYSTEDLTARELAVQLSDQMAQLARTEIALARADLFVATRQAMLGGAMLIGAAVAGACALLALIAAVIAAIATVLPVWAAAPITPARSQPAGSAASRRYPCVTLSDPPKQV